MRGKASSSAARPEARSRRSKSGSAPARQGTRVEVRLGERSYPIQIGVDSLSRAGEAIARRTGATRVALVTVPGVGRRYGPRLTRSLQAAGLRVHRVLVPDGDATKNLRQLAKLYDAFLDAGLDRSSAVVALGGGMVGDLAGYAAASYLRGIPFVQVPTTLLSMVDASVGGKVAVNLPQGKNLVGAFYQPRLVWIDTATLESLPARERAAGMAEIIKAGAIRDAALFRRLESDLEAALALEPRALLPIVQAACAMKAEVVRRDEREGGLRMLLNFGHTLAHAVEKLSRYRRWLHGEAVGMGMVYAARRGESLGITPARTRERLEDLVSRAGLPAELPRFDRGAYLEALRVDKKKQDARIRFVALRRVGRAETRPMTPEEIYPPTGAR
ncbi:MAG: 3-dehydroquinate synthase [Myxococcota bacterium]